jgi:hypothetical protein
MFLRIFLNLLVRFLCLFHSLFLNYFCYVNIHITDKISHIFHLSIGFILIGTLFETFYVIVKQKSIESKWFSTCTFFYIISIIPGFWMIEFLIDPKEINKTSVIRRYKNRDLKKILQQMFYVLTIIIRIIVPKYRCTREQISNFTIFMISIASDAQELQANVSQLLVLNPNEESVEICKEYLLVWIWSLPLFCVNLDENSAEEEEQNKNLVSPNKTFERLESNFYYFLFKNFYWKFFFMILLIDLPYFLVRLKGAFYLPHNTTDYYFFLGKNSFQLALGIYRIVNRLY